MTDPTADVAEVLARSLARHWEQMQARPQDETGAAMVARFTFRALTERCDDGGAA